MAPVVLNRKRHRASEPEAKPPTFYKVKVWRPRQTYVEIPTAGEVRDSRRPPGAMHDSMLNCPRTHTTASYNLGWQRAEYILSEVQYDDFWVGFVEYVRHAQDGVTPDSDTSDSSSSEEDTQPETPADAVTSHQDPDVVAPARRLVKLAKARDSSK